MLKRKKILISIAIVLLISMFTCVAVLAHNTSYNVAFTGSTYIYSGTHIYGDSSDTYYFDNNSSANYNYNGSRVYCTTEGENASSIAYPSAGGYDTAYLYLKYRSASYLLRYKAYNIGSNLCIASGRYGVD